MSMNIVLVLLELLKLLFSLKLCTTYKISIFLLFSFKLLFMFTKYKWSWKNVGYSYTIIPKYKWLCTKIAKYKLPNLNDHVLNINDCVPKNLEKRKFRFCYLNLIDKI